MTHINITQEGVTGAINGVQSQIDALLKSIGFNPQSTDTRFREISKSLTQSSTDLNHMITDLNSSALKFVNDMNTQTEESARDIAGQVDDAVNTAVGATHAFVANTNKAINDSINKSVADGSNFVQGLLTGVHSTFIQPVLDAAKNFTKLFNFGGYDSNTGAGSPDSGKGDSGTGYGASGWGGADAGSPFGSLFAGGISFPSTEQLQAATETINAASQALSDNSSTVSSLISAGQGLTQTGGEIVNKILDKIPDAPATPAEGTKTTDTAVATTAVDNATKSVTSLPATTGTTNTTESAANGSTTASGTSTTEVSSSAESTPSKSGTPNSASAETGTAPTTSATGTDYKSASTPSSSNVSTQTSGAGNTTGSSVGAATGSTGATSGTSPVSTGSTGAPYSSTTGSTGTGTPTSAHVPSTPAASSTSSVPSASPVSHASTDTPHHSAGSNSTSKPFSPITTSYTPVSHSSSSQSPVMFNTASHSSGYSGGDTSGVTISKQELADIIQKAIDASEIETTEDDSGVGYDGGESLATGYGAGANEGEIGALVGTAVEESMLDPSQVTYEMPASGALSEDQMKAIVAEALDIHGITDDAIRSKWATVLLYIAQHESGYDPSAGNNWDSNAVGSAQVDGLPSQSSRGLFQFIPSSFAASHVSGTSTSIYDPVAGAAACIQYLQTRHGCDAAGNGLDEFYSARYPTYHGY